MPLAADDANFSRVQVERIVTVERDNQGAVKIVAECLPHIVPGVLLNTREVRRCRARVPCVSCVVCVCARFVLPAI